ncbi:hypothetical protein [Prochlorococcus marinus]|uniref:hypothetical protein n=1 Tax=Prochlorococcus TaxID=1218 RepID=UPI0007B35B8B|nr:hypothetical protein [Prochlorococcus marinus]
MPQKTPENPEFTHLGWQHGTSSQATEQDHLVLHVDQPATSAAPEFQEVEDAAMPSPTYLWPAEDEQFTTEGTSMIVFDDQNDGQSANNPVFS